MVVLKKEMELPIQSVCQEHSTVAYPSQPIAEVCESTGIDGREPCVMKQILYLQKNDIMIRRLVVLEWNRAECWSRPLLSLTERP